jgi:hypothetical protein
MARSRNEDREAVYIDGALAIHETAKALLVVIDNEEHWIPKACVHEDSEVYVNGDEGSLAVVEWFARQKGWA